MKIRCIYSHYDEIPYNVSHLIDVSYHHESFNRIDKNQTYIVYGIGYLDLNMYYLICAWEGITYPEWAPMQLFEIVDPRPSSYWIANHKIAEGKDDLTLSFKEFVEDPYFYYELVENEIGVDIFLKNKKLMDEEFLKDPWPAEVEGNPVREILLTVWNPLEVDKTSTRYNIYISDIEKILQEEDVLIKLFDYLLEVEMEEMKLEGDVERLQKVIEAFRRKFNLYPI